MNGKSLRSGTLCILLVIVNSCQSTPRSFSTAASTAQIQANTQEARILSEQVYAYGYPLVLMDVTKDMMTHSAFATDTTAPSNQFVHKKSFPDASFTEAVNPNVDTLYSSAWLDLSKEPIVLSLPDTGKRYYLMQMMSAWTDVFANPGSRTTGNNRQDFAVTGPNWKGQLPVGMRQIKSPTNDVWIIGRTQTDGPKDYPEVREIQGKYKLTPLSAWGTDYTPPHRSPVKEGVNLSQTPVDQVESMSGLDFFVKMAEAMKRNPPLAQDSLMIEKMRRIGIISGESFNPTLLSTELQTALNEGARSALEKIINAAKNPKAEKVDGWVYNFNMGRYGTNYARRAEVALTALGASLPQDSLYVRSLYDSSGRRLNGKYRYLIHFKRNQIPPVEALWSVTMYNRGNYFVKNPLNRYALGNRKPLIYNSDGSLDLYIQYQPTNSRRLPNWLPTPRGDFNLVARLYWPRPEVLTRQWRMPPVQRIEELKPLSQKVSRDDSEH